MSLHDIVALVAAVVEAGLLPGALIRNRGLKFICRELRLSVATTNSPFTSAGYQGQVLRLPIAHGEGCYIADERTLDELEGEDRVAFRYIDRKSTRLNSSHLGISYAVFCLKKKKEHARIY